MQRDDAWLRWPDRSCWYTFFTYGTLLTLLWILVYGGLSYLTGLHTYRVRLSFAAEMNMPFVPAAAIVYLSLFPMLWLSPFALHTKEELHRFARCLAWLFLISGVGFLLLPGDDVRSHDLGDGVFDKVFCIADWVNLSFNYFPSLHVGMAVLCARFYSRTATPQVASIPWFWALAITASTILIHQHYVIDVVGGGALAYLIADASHREKADQE